MENSKIDMLANMLRENTGKSMLDSGGTPVHDENGKYIGSKDGYGRNYERNQERDFTQEPYAKLSFKNGDVDFTYNLYHWLNARITYEPTLDTLFRDFAKTMDDAFYLEVMPEFIRWLAKSNSTKINLSKNPVVNTYNHQSLLDQVIQYVEFSMFGEGYIILQIHNGADVRGGYTKPRVFKMDADLCDQEAEIVCKNNHRWVTENGSSWYFTGGGNPQLSNFPPKNLEDDDTWEQYKLCFKGDKGYCPICGAELTV